MTHNTTTHDFVIVGAGSAGAVLARVDGPARGLLTAERTALNLVQMLSGIATLTRRHADALAGTGCLLLDTRKTVPGLRRLSKYATRIGGATNHRMGLDDAVLIKDNHVALAGGTAEAVQRAFAAGHGPEKVEVECDTEDQARTAIMAGARRLLLDNIPVPDLHALVPRLRALAAPDSVVLEASGGITLDTVRAVAETGVDRVSTGRLTQAAPAVDVALDFFG